MLSHYTKMKKQFIYFLFLFLLIGVSLVMAYPKITPYVNDFANLLTLEEESNLNNLCSLLEKNITVEIAIVTVNSTEGEDIVTYANRIGEESGVGKEDKDNGVVLLWSTETSQIAIAIGRGIESVLNDAKVGRIARESASYFSNGIYYSGFEFIILQIQNETSSEHATTTENNFPYLYLVIGVVIAIVIIFFLKNSLSGLSGMPIENGSRSFGKGSFGGGGAKA